MKALVVTSVSAEREAVMRGLRGSEKVEVRVGGVGSAAAAASAAMALAAADYDLVICAGIGGGFAGRAAVGSLVVADLIVAADLGVEAPEGFIPVDKLGFGSTRIHIDPGLAARVAEAIRAAGLPVTTGPVLTISTATGSAATAEELAARVPGAAAEAMEGFGVATAAQLYDTPALEIRAISNAVGPRDRSAWRIEDALKALEAASTALLEVLK